MTPSPAPTTSAKVRAQLLTALELELIRPTQLVLQALGAEGEGLEAEALDVREQQSWRRTPRQDALALSHREITATRSLAGRPWPHSDGLQLRWHCRPAPPSQGYASGTVAVTLFLTNERKKAVTLVERDQRSAFQAELELRCPQGFVARLDPHANRARGDWDEAVNALQFRCTRLRTTWIPQASVQKVVPRADPGLKAEVPRAN